MPISLEADNLGAGMLLDAGMGVDATDQVPGHGAREGIRANQHVHAFRGFRKEHRSLASRAGAADDGYLVGSARCRMVMNQPR